METSTSIETKPGPGRANRLVYVIGIPAVILIVAAVGIYSWLYLYGPCGVKQVESASAALLAQMNKFAAGYQSAPSMNPVALVGPVMQMQQTLMETREIMVPACLQTARIELLAAMESAIRALLASMESKPEATVTGLMDDSSVRLANFVAELEMFRQCAPLCR
jgi:hypothetical protein